MTSSNNQPQEQYAIYRITAQESSGLVYRLVEGPYADRKQAIHKAEELNKSEPEVYYSYVVSEYKGKSWSPERPSSFDWETDTGN